MGILFSRFFKKKVNGLMLGLDNAGKTTILYSLKLNEIVNTIPTIGFNVETVNYKNLNLTIWDIGGQEKLRKLWRHYYTNVNVLIYVVDANDRDRIKESSDELHCLVNEDQLKDIDCVLIYCNKLDLSNSMNPALVAKEMNLYNIKQKWYLQPTVATEKEGIYEGMKWISKNLKN